MNQDINLSDIKISPEKTEYSQYLEKNPFKKSKKTSDNYQRVTFCGGTERDWCYEKLPRFFDEEQSFQNHNQMSEKIEKLHTMFI